MSTGDVDVSAPTVTLPSTIETISVPVPVPQIEASSHPTKASAEKEEEKKVVTTSDKVDEKKFDLTDGAVKILFEKGCSPVPVHLQVISITSMSKPAGAAGGGNVVRYRVLLSDGKNFIETMLSSSMAALATDGRLSPFCVILLKRSISNDAKMADGQTRKILIAADLEVCQKSDTCKRGDPIDIDPKAILLQTVVGSIKRKADTDAGEEKKGVAPGKRLTAISDLNSYLTKWTIRARVCSKGEMKTWTNNRGSGRCFSFELLDAGGGQIRATTFGDLADRYFEILSINSVYEFSNGQLKPIDRSKSWNRNCTHSCEYILTKDTEVQRVADDGTAPRERFNFKKIRDIAAMEANDPADLLGIVVEVSPTSEVSAKKTGKTVIKRSVMVRDDTNMSIEVTLWGPTATNFAVKVGEIAAFKGLQVNDYGGKSLSMGFDGTVVKMPDREEARELQKWWDSIADQKQSPDSLTNKNGGTGDAKRVTISQLEEMGKTDVGEYATVRINIGHFNYSEGKVPWYKACQNMVKGKDGKERACAKKVEETAGKYICVSCGEVHDYKNRYLLNCHASDATGSVWMTSFDEVATVLLGDKSADDLAAMLERNETAQVAALFKNECVFRYWIVKCRIATQSDSKMQQPQQKIHIMSVKPIDFTTEHTTLQSTIILLPP